MNQLNEKDEITLICPRCGDEWTKPLTEFCTSCGTEMEIKEYNPYHNNEPQISENISAPLSEARQEPSIIKKDKDSFFIIFHANSPRGEKILSSKPRLYFGKGDYNHHKEAYDEIYKPVEIIQMWKIGDMELLAEVKWKEEKDD